MEETKNDASDRPVPKPNKHMYAFSKLRAGVDADLIACVRARPVLYDPAHARYMDTDFKNAIWNKIGKQLKASPKTCKRRWSNIRDNYRKALRRRGPTGHVHYKFAYMLGFIDHHLKGQLGESSGISKEDLEQSNDDNNFLDEQDGHAENVASSQISSDMEYQSDNEAEQLEPVAEEEYKVFEKPSTSVVPVYSEFSQSQAVDAFLAALAPPLKGLSPYHLSLAKAEIFATVHKYELKGIVEGGWMPRDVNPLP